MLVPEKTIVHLDRKEHAGRSDRASEATCPFSAADGSSAHGHRFHFHFSGTTCPHPLPEWWRHLRLPGTPLPLDCVREIIRHAVEEGVGVHEYLEELLQKSFLQTLFLLVLLDLWQKLRLLRSIGPRGSTGVVGREHEDAGHRETSTTKLSSLPRHFLGQTKTKPVVIVLQAFLLLVV